MNAYKKIMSDTFIQNTIFFLFALIVLQDVITIKHTIIRYKPSFIKDLRHLNLFNLY